MSLPLQQIRLQIGDNDVEGALRTLCDCLAGSAETDLYDDAILQKSRWSDYKRRNISGLAEDRELNGIRAAVLNITRQLEDRQTRPPQPKPEPVDPGHFKGPQPPPQPQPLARCYFNGDPNVYLVMPNNQILVHNPMLNLSNAVATRVPSPNPAIAWVYLFPNGLFYNIDQSGIIWGVNAFGMPIQMGRVEYLRLD